MLRAQNIRVKLGSKEVLRGVDFDAHRGQITAIVGPNGSGKTTLLRAITQETPFSGSVTLNGDNIQTLKGWQLAARRAVLPQSSRIAFPFTVFEVVRLGLMAGSDTQDERVSEALDRVGLGGFEGRFYQELSGGEQQRVQFARVLAQVWHPVGEDGPRWLILDEPVSSLDISHQLEVMGVLSEFARQGGGVISVMHDLNLTAMYAHQIAVLADGRLLQQGAPNEVLNETLLSETYGCKVRVGVAPKCGEPNVLTPPTSLL